MMNIEEIIKGLECCTADGLGCESCPYKLKGEILRSIDCIDELEKDALELIETQQDLIKMLMEEM